MLSIDDGKQRLTLISIIIPVLMQYIFTNLYGTANIVLLSGYSDLAVTASSVANQVLDISIILMTMITTGSVIITSIQLGAGNREAAARVAGTGSVMVLGISLLIAAINFFAAEAFMSMMNLEGETLALAVKYYRVRALFLPAVGLMNFFNQLLISNGFPRFTLIVGVISNLINLGLSYLALYSAFDIMSPISRVALGAGLAQCCGFALAFFFFKYKDCPFKLTFDGSFSFKIIKLGVAGAMVSLMFRIAQTITTGFVAAMGDDVMNTKVYISNIVAYIPILGYSIGNANSVFMGRLKGAGQVERQKLLYRQNLIIAFSCNLILSSLVLIFHRPLMGMFTGNKDIINASTIIFILDMLVQLPRSINNISEGSLSSNGDVRTTLLTSTVSCWLGSVALAYVFCVVLGWGLVGLWLAFIADETFKSIVYLIRWKSGKWKNIKV